MPAKQSKCIFRKIIGGKCFSPPTSDCTTLPIKMIKWIISLDLDFLYINSTAFFFVN